MKLDLVLIALTIGALLSLIFWCHLTDLQIQGIQHRLTNIEQKSEVKPHIIYKTEKGQVVKSNRVNKISKTKHHPIKCPNTNLLHG